MDARVLKRIWRAGAFVSIAAASWVVFAWLRSDDFAVIGPTPFPIEAIPRSAMFGKPIFSFEAPWIGRIELPSKRKPPAQLHESKSLAGILADVSSKEKGTLAQYRSLAVPGGQEILLQKPMFAMFRNDPYYVELPYVFGDNSVEVSLGGASEHPPIRVRLPGNGIPEPTFRSVFGNAGQHTVNVEPRRWTSPDFPLHFSINIPGEESSARLVQVKRGSESEPKGALIHGSGSIAETWFLWSENEELTVKIRAVAEEPMILKVVSIKGKIGLISSDGKILYDGVGLSKPYCAIRIDHWWVTRPAYEDNLNIISLGAIGNSRDWKIGQTFEATCFRLLKDESVTIRLPWPGSSQFRPGER